MITVEIAPQSVRDLRDLQRRNAEALRATTPGESGFDDLIANATLKLRDAATAEAPRLSGSLAASHRGMLAGAGVGQVFVDPGARNPVSGGRPAVYGQKVHGRNPWLTRTIQAHVPGILSQVGAALFARVDQIYLGGANASHNN